jgi:hypothetical protein
MHVFKNLVTRVLGGRSVASLQSCRASGHGLLCSSVDHDILSSLKSKSPRAVLNFQGNPVWTFSKWGRHVNIGKVSRAPSVTRHVFKGTQPALSTLFDMLARGLQTSSYITFRFYACSYKADRLVFRQASMAYSYELLHVAGS